MTSRIEDFTIGVEEEYQIVNPKTRELRQRVGRILPRAQEAVGDEVTNGCPHVMAQIEAQAAASRAAIAARQAPPVEPVR